MAQRQHKVLGKGIDQPKADFIVMMLPVHRITRHILQRVVHEAHVPFEPEAQRRGIWRIAVGGVRHAGPGCRFLGDSDDAGVARIQRPVHRAQHRHGIPIFAAALRIGHPLPGLAAVIAVEHRGDGIDAQPIDMIGLRPEQRIVDQKTRHLAAAEIVDCGVPIRMKALPWVFMLIQRGAIEPRQAVRINRKMRRHPIDQHRNAGAVGTINKAGKAIRRTKAGRRRIKPGGLIAPAWIIRMFGHRHELNMGKAHVEHIGDQPLGHRIPAQKPAVLAAIP